MPSPKLKVFIVDDHYLILQGLSALLTDEPDIEICGTSKDPTQVMGLLPHANPDILLTDISMPMMTGAELTALVVKEYPRIKVIALSMFNEPKIVSDMIDAGVSGYILKNTSKSELILALNTVAGGRNYFSQDIPDLSGGGDNLSPFTVREVEIIRLIVKEYNNKQIADKLFISERTVETHRRNILKKTGTNNTIGLVKYAYEQKII